MASFLLPATWRASILALYAFARGADDIADDAVLPKEQKRKRLIVLDEALASGKTYEAPDWAQAFLSLCKTHPRLVTHGRDLLSAFLQDTEKTRYHDWDELMQYCKRSAAPIGRAYLDLVGEERMDRTAADHLCMALQILNHVQDLSKDYLVLGRIYLPQVWLEQAKVPEEDFAKSYTTASLRIVINQTLDATRVLLDRARPLERYTANWRLRVEVNWILQIAHALLQELLERDPLKSRVTLGIWHYARCGFRALFGRAIR